MPYKNIVFIKLEKRLLNDPRWWTMSEDAQLIYIKLLLQAAETYNKIPANDLVLKDALRSKLDLEKFKQCLIEIETNFPKFKKNKAFRYFLEFETKTNYVNPKEFPRKSLGVPKVVTDKDKEEEKDKEKEKEEERKHPFFENPDFERVFNDYLEMRKAIRKPATPRAQELVLKTLEKYHLETAIKMLEQSIVNSWQGVFELKKQDDGLTKVQRENIAGLKRFMEGQKHDKRGISEGVIDVDSDVSGVQIQSQPALADAKRPGEYEFSKGGS